MPAVITAERDDFKDPNNKVHMSYECGVNAENIPSARLTRASFRCTCDKRADAPPLHLLRTSDGAAMSPLAQIRCCCSPVTRTQMCRGGRIRWPVSRESGVRMDLNQGGLSKAEVVGCLLGPSLLRFSSFDCRGLQAREVSGDEEGLSCAGLLDLLTEAERPCHASPGGSADPTWRSSSLPQRRDDGLN